MELTWNGAEPLHLGSGRSLSFLADGDEVVLRGVSRVPGGARLGEVRGTVTARGV